MAKGLLAFWREAGMGKWFRGGAAFDAECRERWQEHIFLCAVVNVMLGCRRPTGTLALVVLLDQIPRNIFRGSGHAFATDPLALLHANHAIAAGFDAQVDPALQMFFYLPFEHFGGVGRPATGGGAVHRAG